VHTASIVRVTCLHAQHRRGQPYSAKSLWSEEEMGKWRNFGGEACHRNPFGRAHVDV